MNADPSFGNIIKERRRHRDLTQAELARRVGCATITIRKIEADALRPSVQIAERLAMALGIPLEERADFVRLARTATLETPQPSPLPTPRPLPQEIGEEDLSGRAIRGYQLGEKIGMGGYGAVYRAIQPLVEREVAVKIILPQYADHPDFIRRFEAEAQLVARLEHPHIVPLYDYWREPGVAYLVMRLLRGGSLQGFLQQGSVGLETAVSLLTQISEGLHAAHRIGVIHRDIKPANILLDEDNNAYLADFGIAKNLGSPNAEDVTQMGMMVGSPAYISPEQIRGELVRPQADIYCLGIVLYEMLTGHKPFHGPTPIDYVQQHLSEPLPLLMSHNSGLPARLDDILQRATAKEPTERYPDVQSLLADVNQAISGKTNPITSIPDILPNIDWDNLDNPYKGLRAFTEADSDNFYGRDTLVQELLSRLSQTDDLARFLAVVGPSGSGKSSVVKAGLIPAFRRGGLPSSENWFVVEMMPGAHPLEELEAALLRIAINPPDSLLVQLQEDDRGLLRACKRILPTDTNVELVLVIDQFEELFTLVTDEKQRVHFLDSLITAVLDERSRIRVVITLRADFTDRPLQYADFGELVRKRTEFVLPLGSDELEEAISRPAMQLGMGIEPGLVPLIVRDVGNEPGALPLLQYALTELFERHENGRLTRAAYETSGGVLGALGRRADEIFNNLTSEAQESTRQLFLRLVTLGEEATADNPAADTRRRVLRSELGAIRVSDSGDTESPESDVFNKVINAYGKYRLLTFDRDPVTRESTVEVAHEALLREWQRLRVWLVESRSDIRMQRLLATGTVEWQQAQQDSSYLLRGSRLSQFEGWAGTTTVALNLKEQAFLQASLDARKQQNIEEDARRQRELATAQQLAKTERQRAEEQVLAANNLRHRAVYLGVAALVAVVLAIAAGLFSQESSHNETIAIENAATAVAEGERADSERDAAIVAQESAQTSAGARATAQVEAEQERERADDERDTAIAAQATAQAETNIRATAEAIAVQERNLTEEQRVIAQEQADLATARELALRANNTLEVDPELSILLAQQSLTRTHTREGEEALHLALQQSRIRTRLTGNTGIVDIIKVSSDDRYMATLGRDKLVILWDMTTWEKLFTYEIPAFAYFREDMTFSEDDSQLIIMTGGGEDVLQIISLDVSSMVAGEAEVQTLMSTILSGQETAVPVSYAINSDLTLFAVSYENGFVDLWDIQANQLQVRFPADSQRTALNFSHDGSQLATLSINATIKLWSVDALMENEIIPILTIPDELNLAWTIIEFSPDNSLLATSIGGTGFVWNLSASEDVNLGERLYTFHHDNVIEHLAFNSDSSQLASSSHDSNAKIWDMGTGELLITLTGHQSALNGVAFTADDKRLITSSVDQTVRVWDISSNGQAELFNQKAHLFDVALLQVDNSSSFVASASNDSIAHLLDISNGNILQTFAGHQDSIMGLSLSDDSSLLATSSRDGTAKVWDTQTGAELIIIDDNNLEQGNAVFTGILDVAFQPQNNNSLVTAGADGFLLIHDLASGDYISRTPIGPGFSINNIVFNEDGSRLATMVQGDNDTIPSQVIVWDTEAYEPIATFAMPVFGWDMAFSPDSQYLAVAMFGGNLQVLDLATETLLYDLKGHTSTVFRLSFDHTGTKLISVSFDGTVRYWDMTTGLEQLILPLVDSSAMSVAVSPDGNWLYLGTRSGHVRGFALPMETLLSLADARTTRDLTEQECQQYLRLESCPVVE